jgi:CheY-like chemotaxis protein
MGVAERTSMDSAHRPDRPLVLVVDDDVRSARLLARLLREDGYDVEVAFDGARALGRLSQDRMPDVLVTDIRMPHADGFSVVRYARSRRPSIPVYLVTGYPELATAHSIGDLHLFPKPLVYEQFAEALRAAVPPNRRVEDA